MLARHSTYITSSRNWTPNLLILSSTPYSLWQMFPLTLKVLNFWKFTKKWSGWISDSYCSLKPLWSGMGEVVPTRTSPTLHPPSPSHCAVIILFKSVTVHQLSWLALLKVNALLYLTFQPESSVLDFSKCVLSPDTGNGSAACGLCLLSVDARSRSHDSSRNGAGDTPKLTYGGRQYHAACANFWVNCVDSTLPALRIPELL